MKTETAIVVEHHGKITTMIGPCIIGILPLGWLRSNPDELSESRTPTAWLFHYQAKGKQYPDTAYVWEPAEDYGIWNRRGPGPNWVVAARQPIPPNILAWLERFRFGSGPPPWENRHPSWLAETFHAMSPMQDMPVPGDCDCGTANIGETHNCTAYPTMGGEDMHPLEPEGDE